MKLPDLGLEKLGNAVGGLFKQKESQLVLDFTSLDKWPEKIVRHKRIQDDVVRVLKEAEKRKQKLMELKAKLSEARIREQKFPERALEIYDEHMPSFVRELETVLKAASLSDDVFKLEEQHEAFQKAMDSYKERTQKPVSALKEFLGQELLEVNAKLRALEDVLISLLSLLEEKKFSHVKELQIAIKEYNESRDKEAKLLALKEQLNKEIDDLDSRKIKIKEKIHQYSSQARSNKFMELFSEEEQLLDQIDAVKIKSPSVEEEEVLLKPLQQRLAYIRKQMINDITALNINEQRGFLEVVKDDLHLRQQKLARIEELLSKYHADAFKQRFETLLLPLNAKIEDANTIHEE